MNLTKSTNFHALKQTKTSHLDAPPCQIDKLDNAHNGFFKYIFIAITKQIIYKHATNITC